MQTNTHRIILELGLRYILYPSLSKESNWTITLLVEPFKEEGKGNSPIHLFIYPKLAKFPLTLVVKKYLLNNLQMYLFGKAKAVAIHTERKFLVP